MNGCVEILGDPNKTNVRYTVVDSDSSDLYGSSSVIINDIEVNQINATKVLVFCRKKEHVKELFELFTQCLGPKAYHRPTETMSHAVLLRFKGCTQSRNISKEMKEYVKNNEECRCIMLLKPFCSSPQCNDVKRSCCDICAGSCHCLCTCSLEQCVCPESCSSNDYQSPIEAHLISLNDTEDKASDLAISTEISRRWQTHLHCRLMVHAVETWEIICEVLEMSESDGNSENEWSGESSSKPQKSKESGSSSSSSSSEAESDSSVIVRRTQRLQVLSSSDEYSSSSN
ncbi:hypothetical protein OS493_007062 [Desmophyllum pertusum]|uniref:Uncharacterized protein n=1 Tax=Desmophyllum pertusum TaxID=174260 RepID=A0A9W9ZIP4_9CNID|nr:hypothetical protein OS493_007062 [Desmophyllum pertusum]